MQKERKISPSGKKGVRPLKLLFLFFAIPPFRDIDCIRTEPGFSNAKK